MSSSEIRQHIMLVESFKAATEAEQSAIAVLTEMFEGDEMLAEGLLNTVKDKATAWMKKAAEVGAKALPGLNKKLDQTLQQVKTEISPEAVEDLNKQMDKQGGSNWKSNVGKVAAALAVASALIASPAQARTIYIIEPGHPAPAHMHHGGNPGAAFLGALVGGALGAAMAQPQAAPQMVAPPGYYHPAGSPPGYYLPIPPGAPGSFRE